MDFGVASLIGYILLRSHLILVILFLINSNVQYSSGSVKISTPNSIYPCLDTFDIMVKQNQDFPHTNYSQLIRAYTSDRQKNHFFKEYHYISEFSLPQSNLLHIECSYFAPNNKYYCFSFVAFNRSTGAIHTWTEPDCIPTLEENTENFQSSSSDTLSLSPSQPPPYIADSQINIDEDLKSLQNLPYGSSYRFSSSSSESILAPFNTALNDAQTLSPSSDYEDLNELEHGNEYARKIIQCSCEDSDEEKNYAIVDTFEDVDGIYVEIFSCSSLENSENKCSNSSNTLNDRYSSPSSFRKHSSTQIPSLMCTINFTIPSPLIIRVQIVKKIACGIGQNSRDTIGQSSLHALSGKNSHENISPLIIRNGPLSISPQVPVDMSPHEYQLQSSILRIEATMHYYHVIQISNTIGQIDSSPISAPYHQQFLSSYENGPLVFLFLTILFALLLFALVISIMVNFVYKPNPDKIVQMIPSEDGPHTATCMVDLCSLGQFSFVESGSMELDYYDYGIHESTAVDGNHKMESNSNLIRNHISSRSPGCQIKNKNKSEFIITDIILEENEIELKEDSVNGKDDKIDMEHLDEKDEPTIGSTERVDNRNSCGQANS